MRGELSSCATAAVHENVNPGQISRRWRSALRAWAMTMREGIVAAGVVTNFFRIRSDNPAIFDPVETFLKRMVDAGFDLTTASRGLIFVTRVAMAIGRDIVMETQMGEHPQRPEVQRLFTGDDGTGYEFFRWLMAEDLNGPDDVENQFEFEISLVISSLEHILVSQRSVTA